MRRIAGVFALLAVVAAGKPKPGAHLDWLPTWAAAVEEARALNLPIVVHRHGFY